MPSKPLIQLQSIWNTHTSYKQLRLDFCTQGSSLEYEPGVISLPGISHYWCSYSNRNGAVFFDYPCTYFQMEMAHLRRAFSLYAQTTALFASFHCSASHKKDKSRLLNILHWHVSDCTSRLKLWWLYAITRSENHGEIYIKRPCSRSVLHILRELCIVRYYLSWGARG